MPDDRSPRSVGRTLQLIADTLGVGQDVLLSVGTDFDFRPKPLVEDLHAATVALMKLEDDPHARRRCIAMITDYVQVQIALRDKEPLRSTIS